MEVVAKPNRYVGKSHVVGNACNSSFDCEPSAIDSILGLRTIGDKNIRFDSPDSPNGKTKPGLGPVEPQPVVDVLLELRRERLLRLMAQQQALYEAEEKSAMDAEEMLQLCEHQQQLWLS
ncbi:MAG: hypothetical protein ABL921_17190 [Pirellula sp.]